MAIGEINQRRLRYFPRNSGARLDPRARRTRSTPRPPVLTRQMKLLEDEIGAPLLERGNRGVAPTEAAHALLAYWRGCQSERAVV